MPFVSINNMKIHYEWAGPEQAPVLVFSNGLGTTMRMWEPQLEAFSKHFRVLRCDTRGHGQSGVTRGPYTIEQLGRDIVGLLDALRVERAHFCGLSMGGMIGMFLGLHAAERLHKLVLCSTAARIGTNETWNTRIQSVQNGGMKAVSRAVFERWLTDGYRAAHPEESQSVLAMLESANTEGYIACCGALRDADFRSEIGKIGIPCLAVAGTQDLTSPPGELQFLTKSIPGAAYAELPAAHVSNMEAPSEFNRHVLRFLLA
jgi:3-oxoadipate enol-lactonase